MVGKFRGVSVQCTRASGWPVVDVFDDTKRGNLHIKGGKANVMEC